MGKIPAKNLEWRKKQSRGAIMTSETFKQIVSEQKGKVGKERATKEAGAAYWEAEKVKYAKSKKGGK